MTSSTNYVLIAADCPLNPLTYASDMEVHRGDLVQVPLGSRKVLGLVLNEYAKAPDNIDPRKIKPILDRFDHHFSIREEDIEFFEFISKYYHYPMGQFVFDVLPKLLKRPRDLHYLEGKNNPIVHQLNEEQQVVVDTLMPHLHSGFTRSLIHGVTGSGKTLVYLTLMKEIFKSGKSVLFLLPEINLTPQFLKSFQNFLDVPIYSYNSAVSNSDKYGLWKLLDRDDSPKLIIGVRSSIFLPIQKLGLIIVDEEHDNSFKQDDHCPYNARDLAMKKASIHQIPVVLGSATPSMETYHQFVNSTQKNTFYFTMKNRAGKGALPEIEIVDMRKEEQNPFWPFSKSSLDAIDAALKKGEQVLVFVNRLGFANYLQCRSCGHTFVCPNCSTNLRYFKNRNEVSCQYCNYTIAAPKICPECQNMVMKEVGFGTERIQSQLQDYFKDKKIGRFDRDEIKTMTQLENRLDEFHRGDLDILVGTQMLSKGHNFERVNLVVILGIDSQLNFPDFRATEKVYQLLSQVSGRAGRYGNQSKVMILSVGASNKIFEYIVKHDFDNFYKDELDVRKLCFCPPVQKIAAIFFTGTRQNEVIEAADQSVKFIQMLAGKHFPSVQALGPRPSLIEKRENKFTWNLMVRSDNINELHNAINTFEQNMNFKSVKIKIDIDPYILL